MLDGMTGTLSVVVIHHRTPEVLARCLERLVPAAPGAELLLVDTAPDPTVLAALQRRYPELTIVRAPNHSLAHAVNVGLRHAHAPWIAVMNADVYVEPDTFTRLLADATAHPRAGVLGPLAWTPSGRRQDLGPLYHPNYLRLAARPGGSVSVPWLSGCLQLLRRATVDAVGGYDASLRFYNEDLDYCLRARAAGWQCRLVDAPVVHLGGSSTPDDPDFLLEGLRGGYQMSRRYLPAVVRRLHRSALRIWGAVGARTARRPAWRAAYARLAAMARDGDFDEGPFGTTLQDRGPGTASRP